MERDGRLSSAPDGNDKRSRLVSVTTEGRKVWNKQALHYLLNMPQNMQRIDTGSGDSEVDASEL